MKSAVGCLLAAAELCRCGRDLRCGVSLSLDFAGEEGEGDAAGDQRNEEGEGVGDDFAGGAGGVGGAVEDEGAGDAGVNRSDPPGTGMICANCPIR